MTKASATRGGIVQGGRWMGLVLALLPAPLAGQALAQASCPPPATSPSTAPPSLELVVSIRSIKPNSDMEGWDGAVPFVDDRADVYGRVTIDGEAFILPKVDESDFPHWEEEGVFRKVVSGPIATVQIEAWDADSLVAGGDDVIDLSPAANRDRLELAVDLCSLLISGDTTDNARVGTTQIVLAGRDDNDAATELLVELADGRPGTTNDLALVGFDLIQVVPGSDRLVAGKPTLAFVSVANNFNETVNASVQIRVIGTQQIFDATVPLPPLGPGQVRNVHLFEDAPIALPAGSGPYLIRALATLIPDGPLPETPPDGDCRLTNDGSGRLPWVVIDPGRYGVLWQRVGTLLDAGNLETEERFGRLVDVSEPFLRGTFPVPAVAGKRPSWGIVPPTTAAFDWLATVLSALQIPADAVVPYWLVFELNGVAAVSGEERMVGVVRREFFQRFFSGLWQGVDAWKQVEGLSLGEFAPRAVIVQSESRNPHTGDEGPILFVAAHELGHTYGLSVDPVLKGAWCQLATELGDLACAASGGLEEYNAPAPAPPWGNPARGYWFSAPEDLPEIAAVSGLQCDSHCLMGSTDRTNPHLAWSEQSARHWIDKADYDRLLDRFGSEGSLLTPLPKVLYVAGMVSHSGDVYLDDTFVLPGQPADLVAPPAEGDYEITLLDGSGRRLESVGLPRRWPIPEGSTVQIPITFFGQRVPLPLGAERLRILDAEGRVLAERRLSPRPPRVELAEPDRTGSGKEVGVSLRWTGLDPDGDPLRYHVLLAREGGPFAPRAYKMEESHLEIQPHELPPGRYAVKVLATDGTHLAASEVRSFALATDGSSRGSLKSP